MSTKIFVNLPVKDLRRSMAFFKELGFQFDDRFCDETAACMVISDTIFAMLLTHEKFGQFTRNEIADANRVTEVLTCISQDQKSDVDSLVEKALAAGAREANETMDHGFMYGRSFHDLDGHIWEVIWMDEAAMR